MTRRHVVDVIAFVVAFFIAIAPTAAVLQVIVVAGDTAPIATGILAFAHLGGIVGTRFIDTRTPHRRDAYRDMAAAIAAGWWFVFWPYALFRTAR